MYNSVHLPTLNQRVAKMVDLAYRDEKFLCVAKRNMHSMSRATKKSYALSTPYLGAQRT